MMLESEFVAVLIATGLRLYDRAFSRTPREPQWMERKITEYQEISQWSSF